AGGGNVAVVDDLDHSGLKGAVVVVVGVTQQAFVVLPVVFRPESVVDCHKAAAGAHVLPQRSPCRVLLVVARQVLAGLSSHRMIPSRVAAGAGKDNQLVQVRSVEQ